MWPCWCLLPSPLLTNLDYKLLFLRICVRNARQHAPHIIADVFYFCSTFSHISRIRIFPWRAVLNSDTTCLQLYIHKCATNKHCFTEPSPRKWGNSKNSLKTTLQSSLSCSAQATTCVTWIVKYNITAQWYTHDGQNSDRAMMHPRRCE
jgi:hypothetical protein